MSIERARELLKTATRNKRDELREHCEALIATWDWGSFMRHHVEPDFMLRQKWRRGSPLPGPPNPPVAAAYGHAFDAQARMVVQHQQIPSDDIYEYFWLWSESEGVNHNFLPLKNANAESVRIYGVGPGGRIDRVDLVHDGGAELTTVYAYDDAGHWIRAHMTGKYSDGAGKANRLEEVERDAKGRLVRLGITQENGHRWAQIDRSAKAKAAPTKKPAPKKKPAAKKNKAGAKKKRK